jgi:hypothetical protein
MSLLYSHANNPRPLRHELALLETPPAMGPRHMPYSFDAYVTDVENAIDHIGYQILEQDHEVTPDKMKYFGAMAIAPKGISGEVLSEQEYQMLIGLRGSHDQTISRDFCLGSKVFVCSNLAFSGSIANFSTKQTTFINRRMSRLINESISHIPELGQAQDEKFDAFKNYEFKNARAGDAALVEIFRQGGLSAAQLGKAVREYDKPSYEEHARYGNSAWLVMNSVTEALKPGGANVNHNTIATRTEIADRFLSNLVGVAA